jgi:hypothetical protein
LFVDYRLKPDVVGIGTAAALALPTGWWLSGIIWELESGVWRAIAALLAPVLLFLLVASTELLRSQISRFQGRQFTGRRIGPLGSTGFGYTVPDSPVSELRRELAIVGTQLCAGLILATPAILVTSTHNGASPLLVPGVALAVFGMVNLVPSLPFSGGHILRAVFWHLHEQHTAGTRASFLYSQLIASAGFGFGGFLLIWRPSLMIPAFWCLLIAVIALRSSREELRRALIVDRASGVRAADALSGLNPTVRAAAPLSEAIDILMEQRENGPALVRDRNVYIGMLSIERARSVPRRQWPETETRELVTGFDQLADSVPGEHLLGILQRLDQGTHDAVVVRETTGEIVGLVDRTMDTRRLLRRAQSRMIAGTTPVTPDHDEGTTS